MCGIVGYVGPREAAEFLLEGLRRLEYRGYDSAGVATLTPDGRFHVTKAAGRIDVLADALVEQPAPGGLGIGHTRWATHGAPTDDNAHPHFGGGNRRSGRHSASLAHNGVIENYLPLKERLLAEGYGFRQPTDTEVIAHLIASCLERFRRADRSRSKADDPRALPLAAVSKALAQLRGTYGLAILFRDYPDVIIAARLGSPLVVGVGDGEHFVASDASPLVGHTDKIVYLADHRDGRGHGRLAATSSHRDQGRIEHAVHVLDDRRPTTSSWAAIRTTCSRRSSSSPRRSQNAMRGRLERWTKPRPCSAA